MFKSRYKLMVRFLFYPKNPSGSHPEVHWRAWRYPGADCRRVGVENDDDQRGPSSQPRGCARFSSRCCLSRMLTEEPRSERRLFAGRSPSSSVRLISEKRESSKSIALMEEAVVGDQKWTRIKLSSTLLFLWIVIVSSGSTICRSRIADAPRRIIVLLI